MGRDGTDSIFCFRLAFQARGFDANMAGYVYRRQLEDWRVGIELLNLAIFIV